MIIKFNGGNIMDQMGHFLSYSMFWSTFSTFFIISYLVSTIPMYKLAVKADVANPWLAFIPVLQFVLFLHVINRSALFVLVLLIPFAGIFIWMYFQYEFLNSFGVDPVLSIIGVIFNPIYFILTIYLAFSDNVRYVGYHNYS